LLSRLGIKPAALDLSSQLIAFDHLDRASLHFTCSYTGHYASGTPKNIHGLGLWNDFWIQHKVCGYHWERLPYCPNMGRMLKPPGGSLATLELLQCFAFLNKFVSILLSVFEHFFLNIVVKWKTSGRSSLNREKCSF